MTDLIEKTTKYLSAPLTQAIPALVQVEICSEWRLAELELTNAKGRMFDPSLSSEDKRKNDLAYKVRGEQHRADTLKDLVAIMVQQIEHGRPIE